MKTRQVKVGEGLLIGGGAPVSIQTMWKEPLSEEGLDRVARGLSGLAALGCDVCRFAVPDLEVAVLLGRLASMSPMPLVADIHFDWRIGMRCLDFPIAKLRINPGNIGDSTKVREIARKALDKGVPIRIGVNGGSLPAGLRDRPDRAAAMVEAAEREADALEAAGFSSIVVSMKSSSVEETVEANRRFASLRDYPLHIGVTEAGPLIAGVVRNAVAIRELLAAGIGSTIRVSLSDSPENEVLAGREILSVSGLARRGVRIVSCPRCGRAAFDSHAFLEKWGRELYSLDKDIVVAVMGCAVNGPEEARHADLGITGAGKAILIFRQGRLSRTIEGDDADTLFREELAKL